MERRLTVHKKYLCIPVKTAGREEQHLETLEIFQDDNKIFEIRIPVDEQDESGSYDYYAYVDVSQYHGRGLCLRGKIPFGLLERVAQRDEEEREHVSCPRPVLHFTSGTGWINDPNGLICENGRWQLYFQHNPFNTEWENLCWGSAVSEDLVHWRQRDVALWPDETGTMFSGCGIVNERGLLGLPKDALLYFYTAAGDCNDWSKGKMFTQHLAYSLDGGETLVKWGQVIAPLGKDSRDPKVFWHEETQSYVMVLWLVGNRFLVLRSGDLEHWKQTQDIELPDAWECPDLFELEDDGGEKHWVFWCADGYYYIGDFDGYEFSVRQGKREAYGTKLPYAAQTWSGTGKRVISLAWLRTANEGKLYTGMMAIPRELSLVRRGGELAMKLSLPEEIAGRFCPVPEQALVPQSAADEAAKNLPADVKRLTYRGEKETPAIFKFSWPGESLAPVSLEMEGISLKAEPENGRIYLGDTVYEAGEKIFDLCVIRDAGVIEITANDDIIYLTVEISGYDLGSPVEITAGTEVSLSAGRYVPCGGHEGKAS